MAYISFLLGMALAGAGGYALYSGFDDLTSERGATLTLSGTIGFSVGLVLIGLAFVLLALAKLGRKLDKMGRGLESLAPASAAPQTQVLTEANAPYAVEGPTQSVATASTTLPSTGPKLAEGSVTETKHPIGLAAGAALAAAAGAAAMAEMARDRAQVEEVAPDIDPAESQASQIAVSQSEMDRLIAELSEEHSDEYLKTRPPSAVPMEISHSASNPQDSFEAAILKELEDVPAVSEMPMDLAEDSQPDAMPESVLSDLLPSDEAHSSDDPITSNERGEVIGSYESAGVTYTLYANGSVMAQAGDQHETYVSLEALRSAFERGESIFS